MNNIVKALFILFLITFSSRSYAQMISLGDDENTVYNILYDRVSSYNRSLGDHNIQTFDAIRSNGVVSEIIISMRDGFFYDLGLNSDYAIHYIMSKGVLSSIITVYASISTDQLKNGFSRLYGDRHIDTYYFSDDYKSYKSILLDRTGLAMVIEQSSYNTHFAPEILSLLNKLGVANKYNSDNKKVGVNLNAHYNGKAHANNVRSSRSDSNNNLKSVQTVSNNNDNAISTNNLMSKVIGSGSKKSLNIEDAFSIVGQKSLSADDIKLLIKNKSNRTWNVTSDDGVISFAWNVDNSEYMEYNPSKPALLIESNSSDIYSTIVKDLESLKFKKVILKPEDGQVSKIRYESKNYFVLCIKEEGGSMGNSPCTIIISRSPTFSSEGH